MINYDLRKIKALAFDVDGVLSAETITLHPGGEPMRSVEHQRRVCLATSCQVGLACGHYHRGTYRIST